MLDSRNSQGGTMDGGYNQDSGYGNQGGSSQGGGAQGGSGGSPAPAESFDMDDEIPF